MPVGKLIIITSRKTEDSLVGKNANLAFSYQNLADR